MLRKRVVVVVGKTFSARHIYDKRLIIAWRSGLDRVLVKDSVTFDYSNWPCSYLIHPSQPFTKYFNYLRIFFVYICNQISFPLLTQTIFTFLHRATMSARFMKYVNVAGNQVAIYVAAEVRHAGVWRVIDAIEPAVFNDTIIRVEHDLVSNKLLSTAQVGRTKSVLITSVVYRRVKAIPLTKQVHASRKSRRPKHA